MITTTAPISKEQKRAAMDEVLASATFARSDQLRSFLKFICEQELAGLGNEINEYLIGVEVLGRPANYSPSEDATVRNRAHVLRKKLQEFYEHEGADSPIRIELHKGSYCPYFIEARSIFPLHNDLTSPRGLPVLSDLAEPENQKVEENLKPVISPTPKWKRWGAGILTLAALLSFVAWKMVPSQPTKSALEEFWSPVLASAHPVLICQSPTVVYLLGGKTKEQQFSRQTQGSENPYEIDPQQQVPGSDLIPLKNDYVSLSNALGALKLANLFGGYKKPTQFSISSNANFAAMRNSPTILLGGFNNRWTMSLANNQRFVFAEKAFRHRVIIDKQDPNRVWGSANTSVIGKTSEDFAIISRVFQSETGEILITAAGIFQYGTRAAGELLANAIFWEEFARQAPEGWQKKNLQIVFSVKVIDNTPGPPTLLATHFW
jgi:hypothetical protein